MFTLCSVAPYFILPLNCFYTLPQCFLFHPVTYSMPALCFSLSCSLLYSSLLCLRCYFSPCCSLFLTSFSTTPPPPPPLLSLCPLVLLCLLVVTLLLLQYLLTCHLQPWNPETWGNLTACTRLNYRKTWLILISYLWCRMESRHKL